MKRQKSQLPLEEQIYLLERQERRWCFNLTPDEKKKVLDALAFIRDMQALGDLRASIKNAVERGYDAAALGIIPSAVFDAEHTGAERSK